MKHRGTYERFVRPWLFSLNPETAHHLVLKVLRTAGNRPSLFSGFRPAPKTTKVFGISFPNPVGLAAGFDKNGVALQAWAALGFGFVEIGTVTARPQPGNPKPRIFRMPEQQALINRLGFNNAGADAIAERLQMQRARGRWPDIPVGINIGKSKLTPLETANDDYAYSFRKLVPLADYVVLNISSPNTLGLRSLQKSEALGRLLRVIHTENRNANKPVLLKIAPDLSPAELQQVVATSEANDVAGIIATNTTLDHTGIPADSDQTGGLSGQPLREKSTSVVRAIRAQTRIPVIASGGIFDAESAREKLEAGAQLLQVYTGYIYRGPGLLREIVDGLDSLV
jgi:dihydroorotate dehydrogenase